MEDQRTYYLQQYDAHTGEWREIIKSYESESLTHAGKLRAERWGPCRVLDNVGNTLWQAEGAPSDENAP